MGSRNYTKRTTGNLRKEPGIPEDPNKRNMLTFATREDDTGARRIPAENHSTIVAGSVSLVSLRAFVRKANSCDSSYARISWRHSVLPGPGLAESHVPQYSISVWSIDQ
jgi:hypothetical protein